jgi:hypothetical protein
MLASFLLWVPNVVWVGQLANWAKGVLGYGVLRDRMGHIYTGKGKEGRGLGTACLSNKRREWPLCTTSC